MDAIFVELPPFERWRSQYLDDAAFGALQRLLIDHPDAGVVIKGLGGMRKLRFADAQRQKGKRGGIRVIYYYWMAGRQFWLFAVYGKDMQDDLDAEQKRFLRRMLETELRARARSVR